MITVIMTAGTAPSLELGSTATTAYQTGTLIMRMPVAASNTGDKTGGQALSTRFISIHQPELMTVNDRQMKICGDLHFVRTRHGVLRHPREFRTNCNVRNGWRLKCWVVWDI